MERLEAQGAESSLKTARHLRASGYAICPYYITEADEPRSHQHASPTVPDATCVFVDRAAFP